MTELLLGDVTLRHKAEAKLIEVEAEADHLAHEAARLSRELDQAREGRVRLRLLKVAA